MVSGAGAVFSGPLRLRPVAKQIVLARSLSPQPRLGYRTSLGPTSCLLRRRKGTSRRATGSCADHSRAALWILGVTFEGAEARWVG